VIVREPTIRSSAPTLDDEVLENLRTQLRGQLLQPDDSDYDVVRQLWNAMIDRHPALIARCAGVADVIAAVAFAREHDLLLAVRGGGHNVAGNAVCDGGLMLDLSLMKGIRVDPIARTARAEAGVLWAELDHETQAFGLAAVGGTISTTGIAGLTLGGGFGWLTRQYGLVCDNLLSADVVTADGRFLHASAEENPDLFWGLHGGGGNFGVVTSFEYRLHEVGPTILAGPIFHAVDDAQELFRAFRDTASTAPDALGGMAAMLTSPEGYPSPPSSPYGWDRSKRVRWYCVRSGRLAPPSLIWSVPCPTARCNRSSMGRSRPEGATTGNQASYRISMMRPLPS